MINKKVTDSAKRYFAIFGNKAELLYILSDGSAYLGKFVAKMCARLLDDKAIYVCYNDGKIEVL